MSCQIDVFFFNDTATTEIYTLSLHDALPICPADRASGIDATSPPREDYRARFAARVRVPARPERDRKSTRLNSSHANISYAVFCLKKKKTTHLRASCPSYYLELIYIYIG